MTVGIKLKNLRLLLTLLMELVRESVPLKNKIEKIHLFLVSPLYARRRNAEERARIASRLKVVSGGAKDYLLYDGDGYMVASNQTLWIELDSQQLPPSVIILMPDHHAEAKMEQLVPFFQGVMRNSVERPAVRFCKKDVGDREL